DQEAVRAREFDLERLGVAAGAAFDRREHELAHRIALAPADQRGGTIRSRDRLAVMPGKAVAQNESPGLAVGRGLVLVDHLRLGLEIAVHREQRVVDHVAVVARDVGRGPDRIDVLQVGVRNDAQRRALGLTEAGSAKKRRSDCAADKGTTRELHVDLQLDEPRPKQAGRAKLPRCCGIGRFLTTAFWQSVCFHSDHRLPKITSISATNPGVSMRILVAMMKHETNTFSPIPTDLQRFRDWGMHEGEAVARAYRGTNHPLAAFLDIAEESGAEVVTPVAAEAMPSGPVQRAAYDYLTGRILDALAKGGFDAAFLDLHGAMAAEGEPDGEGGLLERMRQIAPALP